MSTSKKKSDVAKILDELRDQEPKKRMAAVLELKEVAIALGPTKVKADLIGFLAQFLDDEQNIVLELLSQLDGFGAVLGGAQNEKMLIPLLISFCRTDERAVAFKACKIIQRILQNSKDIIIDTIKKLMKGDMCLSKQCAVQLIASLLPQVEANEGAIMELYIPLFHFDNPQVRIMASKYLLTIFNLLKSKDQMTKIFDTIYNDCGQLQKIFGLEALVEFYSVNNNFVLTKFKHISVINSWRINIKVCQLAPKLTEKVSKAHFKLIFEPVFLKFMTSTEPELKSASCQTLTSLCKTIPEEEHKTKLLPYLKKLSNDEVEYIKVSLSKSIVPLCDIVSTEFMREGLLPIILNFMKEPNSQIALGIAKNFQFLASKMSKEALDQKIIRPLLQQLSTNNWRIKCEIIQILKGFLVSQTYLNDAILKIFVELTDDRIDAVRRLAKSLLVDILTKNQKEWCDINVIPRVFASKENQTYVKKQNLLDIIEKTAPHVTDKTFKETYQSTLSIYISDKVSNVKLKSMQVLKANAKLSSPVLQKNLQKLKEDKDHEVRDFAKKLRA